MIAPASTVPPRLGPLEVPSEDELAAAYPEIRSRVLTLSWAAEALGIQAARLEALARAGELLVIPGPWPMRQAYRTGLGYFLPAWQLARDRSGPHPALPAILQAAASAGWTSLELHRFMTAPVDFANTTPAALLRAGATAEVVALIRGEHVPQPPAPARHRSRHAVGLGRVLHPGAAA